MRDRVKTIKAVDHVFGFVFGVVVATVELTVLFMLIDALGLASALQLTPSSGGYFAHNVFAFFKAHIFPIVNQLVSSVGGGI